MSKLPTEIWVVITNYLFFTEKLQLTCACKKCLKPYHNLHYMTPSLSGTSRNSNKLYSCAARSNTLEKNVRKLSLLGMMHYDMQVVLWLPTLFPKITSLEWTDKHEHEIGNTEEVGSPIFAQALQQWEDIESIVDSTYHLEIATHLLEITRCDRLTRLQIIFHDYSDEEGHMSLKRDILHGLLKNIHNAPSIECVTFKETAVRLEDMENLHNSLPKLKTVVLDEVSIYDSDNVINIDKISSKNTMESFSLLNFTLVNPYEQDGTNAASNWISYLGGGCRNLQELNLDSD